MPVWPLHRSRQFQGARVPVLPQHGRRRDGGFTHGLHYGAHGFPNYVLWAASAQSVVRMRA